MLFEHASENFEAQKISIVCVLSGAVTIIATKMDIPVLII